MCGIVGGFGPPGWRPQWLAGACQRLQHRGPDGSGQWLDASAGIALGHRRLAIIDLSEAGAQPMVSACGAYHIVYNGEIYNHLDLRRQLAPRSWRGHSDTETLLACIAEWGIERTLQAAVGMFACAVFDSAAKRLILARDRLGEKPLYYGYAGDVLTFTSELKALRDVPEFDASIDRHALASFMAYSYVPAPHSIYSSMKKLPPGCWLEVSSADVQARAVPEPRRYWSALEVALSGDRNSLNLDDQAAVAQLEQVLGAAVRGQMLADVPLGAFLSGGIDSSTVVALMQAHSSRPVHTFSIGFNEAEYDESVHARLVARHLGTEHTDMLVRPEDALQLVPHMAQVYDEPFADVSQIPTLLLARFARRHVTVALSGDGGDELFGGYNRHYLGSSTWPRLARIPRPLRRALASGALAVSPAMWDRIAGVVGPLLPSRYRLSTPGDKIHKIADVLGCRDGAELYGQLVKRSWAEPLVLDASVPDSHSGWPPLADLAHQMMLLDALTYLPDDVLVKVDRAAMATSLETRVPLLDHRVFELAWRMPMHLKLRDGQGKWCLRQILYRYVPRELVERPKAGFAVPLERWLRGSLREWAADLLNESRLRREGYIDAGVVARRWREHLSGRRNWQHQLWNVLAFEAWLAEHGVGARGAPAARALGGG